MLHSFSLSCAILNIVRALRRSTTPLGSLAISLRLGSHLVLRRTYKTHGHGDFHLSFKAFSLRRNSSESGLFRICQLTTALIARESPRWYIQKNRPDKALKILAHYFAFDDENDITVQFVHKEIETTLALEKEFAHYGIFEFLKTKGNRWRLLILVTLGFYSQWSGNAIISYYLNKVLDQVGITDQKTQLEINGALGIWGWIIAVISSLVIDRFGRRKMFLIATFSMMLVYVLPSLQIPLLID